MGDSLPTRRYAHGWAGRRQRLQDELNAEIQDMQPLLHQLAADTAHLANKEAWQMITAKIAKDGLRGRRGGAVARAVWAIRRAVRRAE